MLQVDKGSGEPMVASQGLPARGIVLFWLAASGAVWIAVAVWAIWL